MKAILLVAMLALATTKALAHPAVDATAPENGAVLATRSGTCSPTSASPGRSASGRSSRIETRSTGNDRSALHTAAKGGRNEDTVQPRIQGNDFPERHPR